MEQADFDRIIDFAVEKEEEAYRFYLDLSTRTDQQRMHQVFEEFAQEELKHKNKLLAIKSGKVEIAGKEKVTDLKLSDYLVVVELEDVKDYQQALIVAMKLEKAAFKMYTDLAAKSENEEIRQTFLALAQEEAKHKLYFEVEYDDNFLTEN